MLSINLDYSNDAHLQTRPYDDILFRTITDVLHYVFELDCNMPMKISHGPRNQAIVRAEKAATAQLAASPQQQQHHGGKKRTNINHESKTK